MKLLLKKWSKSVNRVDKAAYHHDVCYLKNDDTATRNTVCDKNMLKELEGIYNPTLRERLHKSIVSKLIGTKVKFGMRVKNQRTEGPESRTDGETLIFWD